MHPLIQSIVLTPGPEQEVRDWMDRVRAAGGTVNGRSRNAVNVFVRQCKYAGIWSAFRRVNLCVGDFLASFIPLVNSSGAAADTNNALLTTDYREDLGWQTDGSTKFIDTGYTPSEATGGISAYCRSTLSSATQVLVGCRNSAVTQLYRIGWVSGANVNYGTWGGSIMYNSSNATAGLIHTVRRGATDLEHFNDGLSAGTDATSTTPATANVSAYIFAQNVEGTGASTYCASGTRVSGYAFDTGMTAVQARIYNEIMVRFQQTMGRAVYT